MHLRDPARRRLAVLGSPIGHSLSPALHAAAYGVLGLDVEYGRAEVGPGALEGFVTGLGPEWLGLSLTMPLKREVLPLLDRATPLVGQLGVANTLAFRTEAGTTLLDGANTDVDGIVRAVASLPPRSPSGREPTVARPGTSDERPLDAGHGTGRGAGTILGGGATAASALVACQRLGATSVRVFVRDPARTGDLVTLATRLGVTLEVAPLEDLETSGTHRFVIATLPGGAADDLRITPSGPDAVLLDVAYDPWPSALAERWGAAGGRVLSGLDMLVEQAIGQIRFFLIGDTDTVLPDEPAVRRAMRTAAGLPPTAG